MLPDVGLTEYLVIGIVALIVIGPKDLPVLMRKVGQWVGKMRNMASEFRASFDEMARQSELDELRKEVEAMRSGQMIAQQAGHAEVQQTFADIEAELKGGEGIGFPPMMSSPSTMLDAAHAATSEPVPAPEPIVTGPAEAPKKPRRAASKTVISNTLGGETASKKTTRKKA